MSIAEQAEPQLTEWSSLLPPDPELDVDLDVVITVRDGTRAGVAFSAATQNHFDLGWWDTMDQSKLSPVSFTAHEVIGRSSAAVTLTLGGTAHLYNPATQEWSPSVSIPPTYHADGRATFDPRILVTPQYPWVGSLGLVVWASAAYGVGVNRVFARTVVHADGCIASAN